MKAKALYQRHRFPPDIIRYALWRYYRFALSFRDIEDLLAERGVMVSAVHDTRPYANNRAELWRQHTRQRERVMRRFKSVGQAQWFVAGKV